MKTILILITLILSLNARSVLAGAVEKDYIEADLTLGLRACNNSCDTGCLHFVMSWEPWIGGLGIVEPKLYAFFLRTQPIEGITLGELRDRLEHLKEVEEHIETEKECQND